MVDELWNAGAEARFEGGKNDPSVALIKVHAESAQRQSSDNPTILAMAKYTKAMVTKDQPSVGDKTRLDLGPTIGLLLDPSKTAETNAPTYVGRHQFGSNRPDELRADQSAPTIPIMSRGTSGTGTPSLAIQPAASGHSAGRYLPQLDGLRTVAIGLVLVHHAVTPARFGGFIGVDTFFVISGYLITSILLREIGRSGTIRLRRFYGRRMLRLYPPLLATVLVMSFPAVVASKHLLYLAADTGLALTYLTPVALQWNDGISIIYRHTWSLGIEEMFYLAWPAILILTRVRHSRMIAFWVALASGATLLAGCLVQAATTDAMSYLLRSGGILIGCALALTLDNVQSRLPVHIGWAGMLGLVAAIWMASSDRLQGVAVTVAVLASVALVAHLATDRSSLLSRGLGARPMAYFGRISYELYLWHYPIFVVLSRLQHTTFNHVAWLAVPLSLATAMVSHRILTPWIARWKLKLIASHDAVKLVPDRLRNSEGTLLT